MLIEQILGPELAKYAREENGENSTYFLIDKSYDGISYNVCDIFIDSHDEVGVYSMINHMAMEQAYGFKGHTWFCSLADPDLVPKVREIVKSFISIKINSRKHYDSLRRS